MQKDLDSDLLLKTEQLLYFRLTFALVCLSFSLIVSGFAGSQFDLGGVISIISVVVLYSLGGLILHKKGSLNSGLKLTIFNWSLVGFDLICLTGLVHLTRGMDWDLSFLYLLPILLASNIFDRRGVFLTAALTCTAYLLLVVGENSTMLVLVLAPAKVEGLASEYMRKLWVKLFFRSAMFVSFTFIWAAFCNHMSQVAQQRANSLREQLVANQSLIAETKAQAAREQLFSSISSALRSTLDLDQILKTAVEELSRALKVSRCAIICPSNQPGDDPPIWEKVSAHISGSMPAALTMKLSKFLLANKATYQHEPEAAGFKKTFVFDEPIRDWSLLPVREELSNLEIRSLVVQPIIYRSESRGVLVIADCERRLIWAPFELELIKAVAGQVAIAIEHAHLVEQLSKNNRDLMQKNQHLDAKNLELRTIQSQLIHQEKMASLGRMVAGIAHELNNPINFVHGNLPYLKTYCEDLKHIVDSLDALPAEDRAAVDELKVKLKYNFLITDLDHIIADLNEGAERIRYIVKNLRSFSRLGEAELKEASIQEGIDSSLKLLNQYYSSDKIPVEMHFQQLPLVLCYPGQLNQIWMNLLSNAAQALVDQQDPKVTITAELVDDFVLVSIADNGTGIKDADQSKIFEPFYTTKPVGQGTGLGLSICHSIMERHGGQIWFESTPGEGTTFKVKVPLSAKPMEKAMSDFED